MFGISENDIDHKCYSYLPYHRILRDVAHCGIYAWQYSTEFSNTKYQLSEVTFSCNREPCTTIRFRISRTRHDF